MIRLISVHQSFCSFVICVIASLGVFLTAGMQQVYQQGTEEVLEIESLELFSPKRIHHRPKMRLALAAENFQTQALNAVSRRSGRPILRRFESVSTERSQLNGLGGYLRT